MVWNEITLPERRRPFKMLKRQKTPNLVRVGSMVEERGWAIENIVRKHQLKAKMIAMIVDRRKQNNTKNYHCSKGNKTIIYENNFFKDKLIIFFSYYSY